MLYFPRDAEMPWLRTFVVICASILVLVFLALVLLVSLVDLGLSGHGTTALFIGALLATAVAMVLMGLVFLSNRGGHDEGVHTVGGGKPSRDEPPSR